ncbi:Uncharacterized protein BM_BM10058 [Brugia malayi]|nr:Uncharacterized protein BM_BM10058 [Brugia malayi]VIO94325.1 Uncharacterized protein BM_BM10058 [Brugia malayi]
MKIFTVGMDEKPPIKDPVSSDGVTVASTPIITLEKKRTSYKNYVMCLGMLFFIFLFAIIVSKLVYYRIPDDLGLPWFELKHRIGMGCDDCMSARIIQSFYPQRSSRFFESSNSAAPPVALAMQAEQSQTNRQVAPTTLTSQRLELGSSATQIVDSRLDFLRKIIPKIKEQAEKSGIEGVMQVKMLQMDSFEPKQVKPLQLLDGLEESQLQPVINAPQLIDFMTPIRSILLSDLLRLNTGDNDESQASGIQFFGSQQDDTVKGGPMLILGPFLQPQQLQLLPTVWDNNNNIAWSNSLQPHLFDLAQQMSKQQRWINWQWPVPPYHKNSNEKVAQWQSVQWLNDHMSITPVVRQNSLPAWESTSNQWQDNAHMAGKWQSSIQSGAGSQWAQGGWQGQGQGEQQLWSQYPQTWLPSMNQNQYQNNNDWNIQRTNIIDNLDGRMTQAVLPSDSANSYVYNNNANDQWMRYFNQWYINNQRLQHQPIANTVVSQSVEVTGPVLPQHTEDQILNQQQSGITDSLQSQTVQQHQVKPLPQTQQQKQEPQMMQQFLNKPNDNQEQSHLLHQERLQLPMHRIETGLSGGSNGLTMIDDDLNKETVMEQSGPMNDINLALSNPMLFQVDDPPPQSASVDESFTK